jgi:hypothetical protein
MALGTAVIAGVGPGLGLGLELAWLLPGRPVAGAHDS